MNPVSLGDVRSFWHEKDRHPSRRLGQNFLVDANIIRLIMEAAEVSQDDLVLEVGPGLGSLTQALLRHAGRVVAVEKDRLLYDHLVCNFTEPRLTLVRGDMLKTDHRLLVGDGDFKLVANLPYSCGTAILVRMLQSAHRPVRIVATLQLEVAQRLAAVPGAGDYGLLSLWGGLDYVAQIHKVIVPSCFWPAPQVKSAVIAMRRRERLPNCDREFFFTLTKQAFGCRRKQLPTVLRQSALLRGLSPPALPAIMHRLEIEPRARAEDLSVAVWVALSDALQTAVKSARARGKD